MEKEQIGDEYLKWTSKKYICQVSRLICIYLYIFIKKIIIKYFCAYLRLFKLLDV